MKLQAKIIFLVAFFGICSAQASFAADETLPKVVIHASAQVHDDFFTLGEIADITPAPAKCKASAQLAAAIVGRSPIQGATRTITRGDINLKLRQAGVDPKSIDLEGATNTSVALDSSVEVSPADSSAAPANAAPAKPQIVVKAGDPVDIVCVDGAVVIHSKGFAVTSGSVGDTITVRRDTASRNISSTIIDAGLVQLAE